MYRILMAINGVSYPTLKEVYSFEEMEEWISNIESDFCFCNKEIARGNDKMSVIFKDNNNNLVWKFETEKLF